MALVLTDRPAAGRWILPLMFALLVMGCSQQADLIPREVLFQHPERSSPKLSPDGSKLAWIGSINGVPNLLLSTVGDTSRQVLTQHEKRAVNYFYWADDGKRIIYILDMSKGSQIGMYSIELATGDITTLATPPKELSGSGQFRLYQISYKEPWMIAIGLNWRDLSVFDLYTMDIRTGEKWLVEEGPTDLLWWMIGPDLNPIGYTVSEPDGGQSFWKRNPKTGTYKQEIVWTIEDDSGEPIALTPDGKGLYIYDSRGYNSTGIALYNFETGETKRLIGDERYDTRGVIYDPVTLEVEGARILADKSRWIVLKESLKPDFEFLTNARPGNLNITSRTDDDSLWVVAYVYDTRPIDYYLYHRAERNLEFLFYSRDDWKELPLAPMEPISFKARDGLLIEGYITKPLHSDGPSPMVVLVHGGPWSRDFWGFNPEAQWLANRGYTCLQVNFRGSMGFGKQFLNAGNREWGRKIQDDITDGVRWAIKQGYAEEGRIGIYGGSFGGYAALAGVTFTPELYACGVSIVGASDVLDYLASHPPAWNAYRSNLDKRVGYVPRYTEGPRKGEVKDSSDWNERDRAEVNFLKACSPLYHTDQITTPLLIAQGGRDYLVRKEITDKFVAKLRANDLPVDYIVYEDAGHGLYNMQDRFDFYERAEAFLAAYLGGRYDRKETSD